MTFIKAIMGCMLFLNIEIPVFATPTTYYVSTSGSDSNDGRSPDRPWKTLSKVSSFDFRPGDSILFKKGDIWKENSNLVFTDTDSGTVTDPIVVSSYGTGDKPIIQYILPIDGWNIPRNWANTSTINIWRMKIWPTPNRLWLNGREVLVAPILDDVGRVNDQGTFEYWFYNASDSMLYVYSNGNPATTYTSMEGNAYYSFVLVSSRFIIIDGIDFRGGTSQAIYLGSCSYVTIKNCSIGYGSSGVYLTQHPGNNNPSHHIIIENCTFDSGMNFKYGLDSHGGDGTKRGSEDGILLSGAANSCIIRNNYFTGWGHNAVYCLAEDRNLSGVYDNKIHNNYFTGSNLSYGRPFGTDGLDGKCYNNEFFNNIMKNHTVRSQINGNNNWVNHNIFDGQTTSPAKNLGTDGSGQAIELSVYRNNFVCYGNKIDHNLFVNTSEAAVVIRSYNYVNRTYNNKIRNNIFYNTGYDPKIPADTGIAIVIRDPCQVNNNVFQNNCIFNPGKPLNNAIKFYGTKMDVSQFNSNNGVNGNIISGNIQMDPLFIDYLNADYHLQPNSPCIDSGILIPGLLYDLDGNPRHQGQNPDIGPYEFTPPTNVENIKTELPRRFALEQNFPNPFNSSTTIQFLIPNTTKVTIKVYNKLGQEVALLVNEVLTPGMYKRIFDAQGLASGVYFYRMQADNFIETKKLVLLR